MFGHLLPCNAAIVQPLVAVRYKRLEHVCLAIRLAESRAKIWYQ